MGQGRVGHKPARDDKSIWVKLLSDASKKGRLVTLWSSRPWGLSALGAEAKKMRGDTLQGMLCIVLKGITEIILAFR